MKLITLEECLECLFFLSEVEDFPIRVIDLQNQL